MTEQPAGEPTPETPTPAAPGSGHHADGSDHAGSDGANRRPAGNMSAIAFGFDLTVERALWILLLVFTTVTRLWDLGYRTQHHDESIHTTFSWKFATGEQPYIHDPLSHGPFLFHANALVYQLFGGSDATSRLLPALIGIAIVAAPLLLRHKEFLGQWGALTAGALLALSPSYLYYTRFIRHDPYTVLGTMLLLAAIFRFFQAPQRKWIILAFVSVAFLLTNHEIIFAILLAFVLVLWGALVLSRLRVLIPAHLMAMALLLVLLAMNSMLDWSPLPDIPWQTGSSEAAGDYYGQLLSHPLVIGLLLIGAFFVIGCVWSVRHAAHRRTDSGEIIEPMLGSADQGSVAKGLRDAWNDPIGVGIGALLAVWIFFGLFTTLFTHLNGIASGTYATNGTLLYWLGQQDVQRGEQPWFYFITEGLQYEWLAIFLGAIALVLLAVTLLRRLIRRDWSYDPSILFRVFLAGWLVILLSGLSYAGEKMPWLIMHLILPAALLGGTAIEDLAQRIVRWRDRRLRSAENAHSPMLPSGVLAIILVVMAGSFFLIAATLTQGGYGANGATGRAVPEERLDDWWRLLIPLIGSIIAIGAIWLIRGSKPAIYGMVGGALAIILLFQVHAGFRLAFLEGDVSVDTLIYNTVGPDAKQVVEDVSAMSELYLGDTSIAVSNDGCTNWPLEWYFRDFENHRYLTTVGDDAQDLPDVIIGVPRDWDSDCSMPQEISGYTSQTYVFRWHESELSVYRKFAIAPEIPMGRSAWVSQDQDTSLLAVIESIWSSITSTGDPDQQQDLWRLIMYREQPGTLSQYRFKVFVKDDLLPYFNEVRYGQ